METISLDIAIPALFVFSDSTGLLKIWHSSRNCSLRPRQLLMAFLSLSFLSFFVAAVLCKLGLWMVLVFSVIEIVALGLSFLFHAIHITDYEKIEMSASGDWFIELATGFKTRRYKFKALWVKVSIQQTPRGRIELSYQDERVLVGNHLSSIEQLRLARELKVFINALSS